MRIELDPAWTRRQRWVAGLVAAVVLAALAVLTGAWSVLG